ncbi:MAG: 3-dehydroquinate synthase [Archangiaceae bacterium]|nr:3-dehydroquinate synthase [Archangiaceae bacterium]
MNAQPERWGRFEHLARWLPPRALVVADRRVLRLHPQVRAALSRHDVLAVPAGEQLKSMRSLERILEQMIGRTRHGWLAVLGGGTVGDVCTVAAHLAMRGVPLLQIPTTLLAAVDASIGGKGAVNLSSGGGAVKNAAGVFHAPAATWLCPELFDTLSPRQVREGKTEAWKMVLCFDAATARKWARRAPGVLEWLRVGRAIKAEVCRKDPLEQGSARVLLNFGHTLGHAVEAATGFRVSHGDAVGLGMLAALDVGRAMYRTPPRTAERAERLLAERAETLPRSALARALAKVDASQLQRLLAADKKRTADPGHRMVLLERIGRAGVYPVPAFTLRRLLSSWREGRRP